jgi:hypothetical protein
MPYLATPYVGAVVNYSHSIHKVTEVGPQARRGLVPRPQGDGFASEQGGIMEVAI